MASPTPRYGTCLSPNLQVHGGGKLLVEVRLGADEGACSALPNKQIEDHEFLDLLKALAKTTEARYTLTYCADLPQSPSSRQGLDVGVHWPHSPRPAGGHDSLSCLQAPAPTTAALTE